MEQLCYETIRTRILQAIRGKRSGRQISKLLGLKSPSHYNRWETGQTAIKWQQFVHLCKKVHVGIDRALQDNFGFPGSNLNAHTIIRFLVADVTADRLAKDLGIPRRKAYRYLGGSTDPSLENMLAVVDTYTASLTHFCAYLVPAQRLPELLPAYQLLEDRRRLAQEFPYIGEILEVFQLTEYKALAVHQEGYIAERLKISRQAERTIVKALLETKMIHLEKQKYRVLVPTFSTGSPVITARKAKFWSDRNLQRYLSGVDPKKNLYTSENRLGQLSGAISEAQAAEIGRVWGECFSKISKILHTPSKDKTRIQVVLFQSFAAEVSSSSSADR